MQVVDGTSRVAIDITGIAQGIVAAGVVGDGFEHGKSLGRITTVEQPDGPVDDDGHTVGGIVVIDAHISGITQLGQGFTPQFAVGTPAGHAAQGTFPGHGVGNGVDELQECGTMFPGAVGIGHDVA